MEVRWSTEAADDFVRLVAYIREHNVSAAERVAHSIYGGIAALVKFPLSGRVGRVTGTRELVFAPLPFVAVYRVKQNCRSHSASTRRATLAVGARHTSIFKRSPRPRVYSS